MIITIDGPTASGKSSAARLLAKELGYYYLYTGLLYRGLAYLLMKNHGYELENIAHPDMNIVDTILNPKTFTYAYDPEDRERIAFKGIDITPHLKGDVIGQGASIVSTNPKVRERLDKLQRAIAQDHDVVIDGRDSGSVVFPHADKKFFLTASEDVRAKRWQDLQKKRGLKVGAEEALAFIQTRDARDSQREIAPLTIPEGAFVIDNSAWDLKTTAHKILEGIRK